MGLIPSKPKKKVAKKVEVSDDEDLTVYSEEKYDQDAIRKLKKQFKNKLDEFLLDQILMSVMFFENYEKEIFESSRRKIEKMNTTLLKEHQKSCLKPDIVSEIINKHVRYKPHHGPKKNTYEPLVPRRMFIIHDNTEVTSGNEDHYSGIDKPTFRTNLKHIERKGYVKLKLINDDLKSKVSISSEASDSNESSDYKIYGSNEDLEYDRINKFRTPKPVFPRQSMESLAHDFITPIKIQNLRTDDDDDDDDDNNDEENKKRLYKIDYYLDSEKLMRYFRKKAFSPSLGAALGFREKNVKAATYTKTTIFCNDEETHWEIIPAVTIKWPDEEAFEWIVRTDRNKVTDKNNKTYQWPTKFMIDEIKNLSCVLIPRGFMPKKSTNADYHLEWEIGFPQVEKYLEMKMGHIHMRGFLFLVAIFKTFIEPVTDKRGLLIDHIRSLIFWEIEQNVVKWPENKFGLKIQDLLQHLYQHLSKLELPDYFIRDRNLFENIPASQLRKAQEELNSVIQAPVMHFVAALRNLHYTSKNFYPTLDYKRLCTILTTSGIEQINPVIHTTPYTATRGPSKNKVDPRADWHLRRQEAKRKLKQKQKENAEQDKNLNKPYASNESINLKWTCQDMEEDMTKESLILKFFIDHYIEIVKCSIKYEAPYQANMYLKQSDYLARILKEYMFSAEEAQKYLTEINNLKMQMYINKEKIDNPPQTPSRNSYYVSRNMIINQNTLDVQMLHDQYNKGNISESVIKKRPNSTQSTSGADKPSPRIKKIVAFSAPTDVEA